MLRPAVRRCGRACDRFEVAVVWRIVIEKGGGIVSSLIHLSISFFLALSLSTLYKSMCIKYVPWDY